MQQKVEKEFRPVGVFCATFKVLDFDMKKEFWNNRIRTHDLKLERGEKRKEKGRVKEKEGRKSRKRKMKKAEVL